MALGNQIFKVIGMWRDNSESSQDNKYAYENFNMRIEARDGNTQLSMENERGNERIDIVGKKISESYTDAQASIANGLLEIKGTPIGYCQIGDDILLFTTETERMSDEELQEYNEDPTYITNKKNIFTLSSAKIQSISVGQSSSTLKLFMSLFETSDWVNFLDDLEVKIIISTLTHDNIAHDEYSVSNYSAIGVKTAEPINNGLLYDFTIDSAISGDYIFVHSIEFRYNNDLAGVVDLRKLFSFSDYKYEMMNSIFTFPYYNSSQSDFTTGFTTSGGYNTQEYNISTINGDFSRDGNTITFDPYTDYTDTINQVFVQDISPDHVLSGLICDYSHHINIAQVDNNYITVPNNAKHSEVVVLRCIDEPEDPSLIDITALTCTPAITNVPINGTFNVTVTPTPSNALCTATCDFYPQHIQLIGRNGNIFTFKLLSLGDGTEDYVSISFSCLEKPSIIVHSLVYKGETKLVDTPLSFEFGPEGNEEFQVKIYSNQYTASDLEAYVDGIPIEEDQESGQNSFIYTVGNIQDVTGGDYTMELDVYARPISQGSDQDRSATLTLYFPGHIYFTSIALTQRHYVQNSGSGGGSGGNPNDEEQPDLND